MENMTNIGEKEVWQTYLEYPFIEVNQFGEVRTKDRVIIRKNGRKCHVKGRILKQQLNNKGYLYVEFRASGKQVFLYVHRLVASVFIPNPLGLPEVNHIDCNPTNNAVSNLEWCTHEYNVQYREKYGKSAREVFGHPVFAVNLKTQKVFHFDSYVEAGRQLGVDKSHISAVIRGKQKTAGGYWFTEDESEITKEKIQEIKNSMYLWGGVIAVNLETLEVFRFESQHEAARQLGAGVGHINNVLKGLYRKTHGYWFCYADEDAVEKTREKFGDEVAYKVEKLMDNKL